MASNVKVDKITPTTACGTVTLGDSGDTISIPSGASLSIGGSVSGIDGVVNWDTTAKTSAFTAVAGTGYFVNTTSAAITVTLPATPTAGDLVAVKDYAFTADTNNITLARNGSNIQGIANDFKITTQGRSVTLIYVDGTQGWLLTGASQKTDISTTQFVTATGGTVTCCGNYKIHTFTSPGTFTVTCAGNACGSNTVDYLVVAGGGGGGYCLGGGGGAGGFRESSGTASGCYTASPLGACVSALPVTATAYPITVGGGGSGATSAVPGGSGSNSVFSTITSAGGGGGGGRPSLASSSGGSGGGGGGNGGAGSAGNTPPVSPPQGNSGGTSNPQDRASAGGGATQAGDANVCGANGGAGATTSISASATAYAGGGGGGGNACGPLPGGCGGAGGGGAGGGPGCSVAGTANTGGGGGGGTNPIAPTKLCGAAGGSGIVIIRYKYQ